MSIAITADEQPIGLPRRFLELVPGIALLFVIGFAGKFIEQGIDAYGKTHHVALPKIEYVLWAILIGLVIANTVGVPRIFRAGVATYEFWLKIGIVSLFAVVMELAIAITLMVWLGGLFKLSPKLTSLLAIGSSICGVSAIIAGRGAINARDEDASFAIAAILALGAFGLFAYPVVAALIGMSDHAYGLWVGLAIDNTAEAAAAGALWSDQAGKVAVLAKTTRNAMIGFVVLGFAIYWATRGQAQNIENKALFLWNKFPKFVLGFLIVSLLATFGAFS